MTKPAPLADREQAGGDPSAVRCDAALIVAFGLLGKRWNGLVIGTLATGGAGFADLRRRVGAITDLMLADRLAELAAAGIVQRRVTDARPPGVRYDLTPAGRALGPILDRLSAWAEEYLQPHCSGPAGD